MAEQLTDETVDWILNDLEEKGGTPAEVARQARRLREYIADLRDQRPRYAQPCDAHEYIEPGCPDCGKAVVDDGPSCNRIA